MEARAATVDTQPRRDGEPWRAGGTGGRSCGPVLLPAGDRVKANGVGGESICRCCARATRGRVRRGRRRGERFPKEAVPARGQGGEVKRGAILEAEIRGRCRGVDLAPAARCVMSCRPPPALSCPSMANRHGRGRMRIGGPVFPPRRRWPIKIPGGIIMTNQNGARRSSDRSPPRSRA